MPEMQTVGKATSFLGVLAMVAGTIGFNPIGIIEGFCLYKLGGWLQS